MSDGRKVIDGDRVKMAVGENICDQCTSFADSVGAEKMLSLIPGDVRTSPKATTVIYNGAGGVVIEKTVRFCRHVGRPALREPSPEF